MLLERHKKLRQNTWHVHSKAVENDKRHLKLRHLFRTRAQPLYVVSKRETLHELPQQAPLRCTNRQGA